MRSASPAGDVAIDRVVLGDIDGDGRLDYGVIQRNGDIHFWRNNGIGNTIRSWQSLGLRSPSRPLDTQDGYSMWDLNGDGRDDLLYTKLDGETTTWTNARSCKKGKEGDGLNVAWRQAFYKGMGTGPTHKGFPGNGGNFRARIHFARIYGESTVTGNVAKMDYVFMEHKKEGGKHRFNMRVWKNTGYGGTKLLADGNRYCNMMGHDDGRVDYVWVWGGGMMEMWRSRGRKSITNDDPDGWWEYKGYIWEPPEDTPRRDLHLADMDGDGLCDIVHVNPDSGSVKIYKNTLKDGKPTFKEVTSPSSLRCDYKKGLGFRDSKEPLFSLVSLHLLTASCL